MAVRRRPVTHLVATAIFALAAGSTHADDNEETSLGTVTSTGTGNGFFAAAPAGNVGKTPREDRRKIQRFNRSATNAETLITKGQFDLITPTDSYTSALKNMPNTVVVSSGDSMDGDDVYINGFDKKLINFTLDGVPLNDNDSYAYYTNEFIPSRLIAGTKYYPGAESAAIAGLSAFGGSVETYSLNPSPYFFVAPMVGAGSFGKYNYGGLINTGLFAKGTIPTSAWIYVNQIKRDGYFQNNPATQTQFLFKSVSQVGPGALTLFFSQNNQRFNYYNGATAAQIAQFGQDYNSYTGNPFLPNGRPNTYYTGYNYNQYLNWLGYAKYDAQLSKVKFSNQFYYYYGSGFGAGATTSPTSVLTPAGTYTKVSASSNGVLLRNSINDTHRWGNILRLAFPLGPVHSELGFWYNHNNTLHDARYFDGNTQVFMGSSYREPVVTDTYEPYAVFKYKPIDALTLSAGVKYLYAQRDFIDYVALAAGKPGQFDSDFRSVLPSVGMNLRILPQWHIYANFTQNANPPAYNQFYTGTFNPDLQPQEANTYDVGTYWDTGFWSGALNAFRLDFRNYILQTTVQVGSYNQTVLLNAGKALNQGIAWQNNFVINNWLSAYLNLGLLDARITSSAQPFPYAPHHTESAGLIVDWHGLRASLGVNEIGNAYYNLGGKFLPLGSRFHTDASIRYTYRMAPLGQRLGFKDITAALYLNNLFDRRFIQSYTGSSSNPNLKLNLPTNVYATLEARF